jgi:hypothetical protein
MTKRSSLATGQMYDSGPVIEYMYNLNKMAVKRLLYKVRRPYRNIFFINHATSIFDIWTYLSPYIE